MGYTISICRSTNYGLGRVARELSGAQVRRLSQVSSSTARRAMCAPNANPHRNRQAYFAANLLLYPSIAASKASVALLVIAIKPKRWIVVALYGVIGIVVAWGIAGVLITALQCGPTRWTLGPTESDTCIDQYAAQLALKAVDMLTDVALSLLPAAMMATVQTAVEKRIIVALMFAFRLAYALSSATRHFYADVSQYTSLQRRRSRQTLRILRHANTRSALRGRRRLYLDLRRHQRLAHHRMPALHQTLANGLGGGRRQRRHHGAVPDANLLRACRFARRPVFVWPP